MFYFVSFTTLSMSNSEVVNKLFYYINDLDYERLPIENKKKVCFKQKKILLPASLTKMSQT